MHAAGVFGSRPAAMSCAAMDPSIARPISAAPRFGEKVGTDESIVHHHVRMAEKLQAARGDEARITGATPDQVDGARLPLEHAGAAARPEPRWRRGVSPGQVEDDLVEADI